MKILQIVNPVVAFPAKTIGGTERVVEYLIDELIQQGHEVTLMAHSESKPHPQIKFIPIGTYLNKKNILLKIWFHILYNKYDVIHNHGRLIYFLPAIWSKTRKIHTFHMAELGNKSFYNFLRLRPKRLTLTPCAKWIQEQYKNTPANWNYVNNGIPLKKYKYTNIAIKADAELVIICRIGPGKGILDAIEIAKKSGKSLIIAGKGGDYPHEKEWFNKTFMKQCDGKQIKYIGTVDDEGKQKLLEGALGLLMLSSDVEAFNLTMIEANACGCPVLTYNRFFPPDFIKPRINGFIGNTQEELIAHVKQLKNIIRSNCRLDFEQNYTSEIMAKNYLKIYNTLV